MGYLREVLYGFKKSDTHTVSAAILAFVVNTRCEVDSSHCIRSALRAELDSLILGENGFIHLECLDQLVFRPL